MLSGGRAYTSGAIGAGGGNRTTKVNKKLKRNGMIGDAKANRLPAGCSRMRDVRRFGQDKRKRARPKRFRKNVCLRITPTVIRCIFLRCPRIGYMHDQRI